MYIFTRYSGCSNIDYISFAEKFEYNYCLLKIKWFLAIFVDNLVDTVNKQLYIYRF